MWIGKTAIENRWGRLPTSNHGGFVFVGEAVGFHAQAVGGDAPALAGGGAAVALAIPPLFEHRDGDIALAVADTVAGIVDEIAVAVVEEAHIQPVGDVDERIVLVDIVIGGGIFVEDSQLNATVLAHVEAGEIEVGVVGMEDGRLVLAGAAARF